MRFVRKRIIRVTSFVRRRRRLAPRIRYAAEVQSHRRESASICGPCYSTNEARKHNAPRVCQVEIPIRH
ncbi:hypothetical protein SALB1_3404 [Salinisphaera sp. LB1]|nr:hypothetical protein SALB1_3404 [Salinisphaera sp. LB1]